MGRTRAKRLRGFGNAIVRPLAVAFVESVIETFVDAARFLGLGSFAVPVAVEVTDPAISDVDEHAADVVMEQRSADVVVEDSADAVVEESAA